MKIKNINCKCIDKVHCRQQRKLHKRKIQTCDLKTLWHSTTILAWLGWTLMNVLHFLQVINLLLLCICTCTQSVLSIPCSSCWQWWQACWYSGWIPAGSTSFEPWNFHIWRSFDWWVHCKHYPRKAWLGVVLIENGHSFITSVHTLHVILYQNHQPPHPSFNKYHCVSSAVLYLDCNKNPRTCLP